MTAVDPFTTHVERASERELVITRTFRAQPRTVFAALTEPAHLRRWWAPRSRGVALLEVEADVRVGGAYRYVFGRPGAPPMAFTGVYREVEPGVRLVYTQIFEPMRDAGEVVVTSTFAAVPGGTRYVSRERYPSRAVLEGALASGMEPGMRESLDQLAALVVELAAG